MPETRPLQVFLCHASQDKPAVRKLFSQLKSQTWVDPWLDEVKLLPGMDWELEIFKAIREADVIIVCLSNESVAKEGYVQKEFKRALGFAERSQMAQFSLFPCDWMIASRRSNSSSGNGWITSSPRRTRDFCSRCISGLVL